MIYRSGDKAERVKVVCVFQGQPLLELEHPKEKERRECSRKLVRKSQCSCSTSFESERSDNFSRKLRNLHC